MHAFIKIEAKEGLRESSYFKKKRNSWKRRFLEGFQGSGKNI
jgi:hypothetical protein